MSEQPGARKAAFDGAMRTDQGKPKHSQNKKILKEPNFSWSN